jgi:hypothetical protein
MGRTFVSARRELGAPGFWLRDWNLELWLRFLALHIEDPKSSGSVATKIRDQWLLASGGSFNGCVPHGLEDAVATAEGAQLLRNAVHALLDALSKGPTQLSASTLNLMGISSGSFRGDIDAWRLVEVSQAFLDSWTGK